MGEDIRSAKNIYEMIYGETAYSSVNEWVKEAKDIAHKFGHASLQETEVKLKQAIAEYQLND